MLTGPAISLALSILFLPLVFFGGVLAQIGLLGFSMNLVTVVYNLMPFTPTDGKSINEWSKLLWALLFVPITLFCIAMTLFVPG
jgi:Zn-dependent protease